MNLSDKATDILIRAYNAELTSGQPLFRTANYLRNRCRDAADQILALIDKEQGEIIGYVGIFEDKSEAIGWSCGLHPFRTLEECGLKLKGHPELIGISTIRLPAKQEEEASKACCEFKGCTSESGTCDIYKPQNHPSDQGEKEAMEWDKTGLAVA